MSLVYDQGLVVRCLKVCSEQRGSILFTGPAGSGKSTTMLACMRKLGGRNNDIVTVKDAIGNELDAIEQTELKPSAGTNYASSLADALSRGPEVVMVGEIRDADTAKLVVRASSSDCLVLSTLRADSVFGALVCLQEMGISPADLSASLNLVVTQRLVRRLCADCKQPHLADESECRFLQLKRPEGANLFRPEGCDSCSGKGYQGWAAFFEVMAVDKQIQHLIQIGAPENVLLASPHSVFGSMRTEGAAQVLAGITTVADVQAAIA